VLYYRHRENEKPNGREGAEMFEKLEKFFEEYYEEFGRK